jgi:hypothetical protein
MKGAWFIILSALLPAGRARSAALPKDLDFPMTGQRGPLALALPREEPVLAWMETTGSEMKEDSAGAWMEQIRRVRVMQYAEGKWKELPPAVEWKQADANEWFDPECFLSVATSAKGELHVSGTIPSGDGGMRVFIRSFKDGKWGKALSVRTRRP